MRNEKFWLISNLGRDFMFSNCICASVPFGTTSIFWSRVRSFKERRPISSTVPSRSPILQKSPTCTALSISNEMPPKRFSRVFCAAKATARPPIPRPASVAETFTPSNASAAIKAMINMPMRLSRWIRIRIDSPPPRCVRVRLRAMSKPRSEILLTSHPKHTAKSAAMKRT